LRDDTVLLCDGTDCGLEFHLQCCVPTVTEIPDQEWYCFDCSTTGSTQVLQQYLEANDDRKAAFDTWSAYRESLWEIDLQEEASSPASAASASAASTTAKNKPRRPKSELDRAYQSHELALRPERKLSDKSKSRSSLSKKQRARHSNIMAAGNIMAYPNVVSVPECLTSAVTMSQMDTTGEQHRHPTHFLGRPVRLYNPEGNTYHTGRIVDWRETSSWPNSKSKTSTSATARKSNSNTTIPQRHGHESPTMTEYLVRFTAGMDDRKTPYQHWIVLEEHGTLSRS
jgi:hypothetical protein